MIDKNKIVYFEINMSTYHNMVKSFLLSLNKNNVDQFTEFLIEMANSAQTGNTKLLNAINNVYTEPEFQVGDDILIKYSAISSWSCNKDKTLNLAVDGEFIEGKVVDYTLFSNHPYGVQYTAYKKDSTDDALSVIRESFREVDLQLNNRVLTPINRL